MNDKSVIEKNKKLIEKYPFLAVKEYDFDTDSYYIPDDYDYSTTWLDGFPQGWVDAFGEQMCQEIKEALEEYDYVDKYIIIQTKEKFGAIRLYSNGVPEGCRVFDIIEKYEHISARTCCKCGKPATKISMGWICPWCDDCAKEIHGQFWDVDEYFEE